MADRFFFATAIATLQWYVSFFLICFTSLPKCPDICFHPSGISRVPVIYIPLQMFSVKLFIELHIVFVVEADSRWVSAGVSDRIKITQAIEKAVIKLTLWMLTWLDSSGSSGVFILGATGVATLSSGGHTTNTFVLNYRVCNCLYQIINTQTQANSLVNM